MGLDCYIVHGNDHDKAFTHEDDERLKDINLCGGMMSGNGSDGSFRGKAYEPLIDELMQYDGGIWHKDEDDSPPYVTSDELKEQAEILASFLEVLDEDYTDEKRELKDDDIVYQTHNPYEIEYTYKEVKDLMTLLRVASERKAIMHVWW